MNPLELRLVLSQGRGGFPILGIGLGTRLTFLVVLVALSLAGYLGGGLGLLGWIIWGLTLGAMAFEDSWRVAKLSDSLALEHRMGLVFFFKRTIWESGSISSLELSARDRGSPGSVPLEVPNSLPGFKPWLDRVSKPRLISLSLHLKDGPMVVMDEHTLREGDALISAQKVFSETLGLKSP